MRQRPLQIAILGGTTALVIFLSLLATTPLLYRHLAFAPSEQGPAPTADEPLDLQNMSTYQLLATSPRILAPAKRQLSPSADSRMAAFSSAISVPAVRAWNCAFGFCSG